MEKRTNVDFSKHVHSTETYVNEKWDKIRVDYFKEPNTWINWIKFTNTDENLIVTGDFWNWIFSRPFVPKKGDTVTDMYWAEKLRTLSTQTAWAFDTATVDSEINEIVEQLKYELNEIKEKHETGDTDYEWDEDDVEIYTELIECWNNLLNYTNNELEYLFHAYDYDWERPHSIEDEDIPNGKKGHVWLRIIFDAYEEMCSRL